MWQARDSRFRFELSFRFNGYLLRNLASMERSGMDRECQFLLSTNQSLLGLRWWWSWEGFPQANQKHFIRHLYLTVPVSRRKRGSSDQARSVQRGPSTHAGIDTHLVGIECRCCERNSFNRIILDHTTYFRYRLPSCLIRGS